MGYSSVEYDTMKKKILKVEEIQEMLIKKRPLILSINSYLGMR